MPDDARPELTVEAAAHLAATELAASQSKPLRIPPGCSIPVEMMGLFTDQFSAPSAEPPATAGLHTQHVAAAGASAPNQEPPKEAG